MTHPWDRRDDETPKAYSNFLRYRDAGPDRSLSKVFGVVRGQLSIWSSKYNWPSRATAWDDHLRREADQAAIREAKRRASDWVRRRTQSRDRTWDRIDRVLAKFDRVLETDSVFEPRDVLRLSQAIAKLRDEGRKLIEEEVGPEVKADDPESSATMDPTTAARVLSALQDRNA